MIVVTVMYPNTPGSKFDMNYYLNTHIPWVDGYWKGNGYQGAELVSGVAGASPDESPEYQVIAILKFDSMEALQDCLAKSGEEMLGDIPNFTDVQPVMQINEPLG